MSEPEEPAAGSTRPYLVRAIYEWSLDEGLTPQVMVDVSIDGVSVPTSYVRDGKIVLNLHPSSVRNLEMTNEFLMFSARFSGRAEDISIPVEAVLAVYARENGQGIVFQSDGSGVTPPPTPSGNKSRQSEQEKPAKADKPEKTTPHLKVVK